MEKKGIFLTHRHVSWVLSFFIISSFFIFISGYFLGKKKAVEKFYNKVDQESLSDHIYYSVCSLYENDEDAIKQESTEDNTSAEISDGEPERPQQLGMSKTVVSQVVHKKKETDIKNVEKFYAELIGFGTLRAANRFLDKLKKQGFSVVLKKRKSKSARGRTITWYQVITEKFDNKSDLIAFVDIIKDKEKLKGVRIVQC